MKYINADKLKEEMIGRWSFREESSIFKLIDELSEEREDVFEFINNCNISKEDWLVYLERETYNEVIENMIKSYINISNRFKQPNPLKVAIKGDGTEEYGKKIKEYLETLKIDTHELKFLYGFYFINENNHIAWKSELPQGYTEISLKEEEKESNYCTCGNPSSLSLMSIPSKCYDCRKPFIEEENKVVTDNSKVNTYPLNRVEELEKELIDLKLKLKQNVLLEEDSKTLNKELEEVMNDRDDLAKRFIEFKNRENVILEASVKEMENRKRVLINKILDFNNQYKNSISTIQDFKNGVHKACAQIISLVEKM